MQTVTDDFIHGNGAVSNFAESEGILGPDGLRISQVTYVKRYLHEVIRGTGEVQVQYRYRSDGEITFVGYELFSGAVGDAVGSLIIDISGSVNPGSGLISANMQLVRGSGSAQLYSYSGTGSYVVAKNWHCSYEFTVHS